MMAVYSLEDFTYSEAFLVKEVLRGNDTYTIIFFKLTS